VSAITLSTNELLDRYMSGAITAPQEAELERRAADDPVLAEALAGLVVFPEADHAGKVAQMVARTEARQRGGDTPAKVPTQSRVPGHDRGATVRPLSRYLAAASVLLLLAVAVFLLPRFAGDASGDLALQQEAPNVPEPSIAAPAPPPVAVEEDQGADQVPERPAPRKEDAPAPPPPPPPAPATAAPAAVPEVAAADPIVEEMAEEETDLPPPPAPVTTAQAAAERAEAERLAREAALRSAAERRKMMAANRPVAADQSPTASGPPATVTGRITDERGEPISGALVRLPGLPIGERTDTNGIFRLDIDATTSRIEISHPGFAEESFDIRSQFDDIQLSLEDLEQKDYRAWTDSWAATKVPLNNQPSYALPEEGYGNLRQRIEENKPASVPAGKVKLSFTVNPDGTLEDFVFKGRPSQETMDYVGGTIARTSIWNVVRGDKPVRVYFKVVFDD